MGAAQRNYYGKALARLAKERDDVVVLDADELTPCIVDVARPMPVSRARPFEWE